MHCVGGHGHVEELNFYYYCTELRIGVGAGRGKMLIEFIASRWFFKQLAYINTSSRLIVYPRRRKNLNVDDVK